jgi:uncharacterized protein
MDKATVIEKLRAHESELKAAGIVHLRLFGSVARGEADEKSDVDLMADFDESKHLTILNLVGLQNRLSDLLGIPVDLSQANRVRQHVQVDAMRDAEVAF